MAIWAEQVKSGVRLAFMILGTLVILAVLGMGLHLTSLGTQRDVAFGAGLVLAVTIFLFATVARWAKWFFGACCGNTLRVLGMAALGRTTSVPSMSAPRTWFLGIAGLFAVMAFLSYRFADHAPNRLDCVCLVGALIAAVYSLISAAPIWPAAVALMFLSVAWFYDLLTRKRTTDLV